MDTTQIVIIIFSFLAFVISNTAVILYLGRSFHEMTVTITQALKDGKLTEEEIEEISKSVSKFAYRAKAFYLAIFNRKPENQS